MNIVKGECIDVMNKWAEEGIKVDLVLCDPPYGTTASSWDKDIPMNKMWECYNKLIKANGTIIIFANGIFTPRVMASNLKDYKYRWVWVKKNSTNFVHAKNRPMTKSEDILVFSKGAMGHLSQLGEKRMTYNPQGLIPVNKIRKGGKANFTNTLAGKRPSHKEEFLVEYTNYPTDVLMDYPELTPAKKVHPNEKPVELLKFLIKTYSNRGEVVLDNCMGSASTGEAALKTGRDFLGIEKEDKYFQVSVDRLRGVIESAKTSVL